MGTLFDSLQLNFDTSKFGDALDPKGTLSEEILLTTPPLTKWQYDAVAANNVARTTYLKNPLANVVNTIISTANTLYLSTNTYFYLPNANGAVYNLETAANNFFRHTQRLSGLEVSSNSALPDFFSATSYGRSVFPILSKFEGVANTTPILGSMTSLFIEGDLITYSVQLESVRIELQNSINTIGALPPYTYSSNLSSARITQIVTLINNVTNLMNTRRTHDINFFGRVIAVSNNYMEISRYSGFADVEAFLIENYVGTETLKNNL
jgi:hypothetical protein